MCEFRAGDEVVCVDASPCRMTGGPSRLILGGTYTVKGPAADGGVFLWEVLSTSQRKGRGTHGFFAFRFRKVQRRTSSLTIEAFLTIKPGQYEEPKRAPAKKRERA